MSDEGAVVDLLQADLLLVEGVGDEIQRAKPRMLAAFLTRGQKVASVGEGLNVARRLSAFKIHSRV